MNKLMKKSSGIIVAICCVLMLGANVLTVYGANYKDSHWELTANPTGTTDTDIRAKQDSSKVYVKNLADSAATVSVSIYAKVSSGEDDCTYNPTAAYNKAAYQISVGQYKYCSSTVYEEHGYNTPTFLRIGDNINRKKLRT